MKKEKGRLTCTQLAAIKESQGASFVDLKESRRQVQLLLDHIAVLDADIEGLRRQAAKEDARG